MKRLILLGFLALVGCEGQGKGSSSYEAYAEQIRAEGVAAFNAGIPPNANPRMRYSDEATWWLEGYIEAKTKAGAQ